MATMTVIVRKRFQLRGQEKCLVVVFHAVVSEETILSLFYDGCVLPWLLNST